MSKPPLSGGSRRRGRLLFVVERFQGVIQTIHDGLDEIVLTVWGLTLLRIVKSATTCLPRAHAGKQGSGRAQPQSPLALLKSPCLWKVFNSRSCSRSLK